WHRPFRQNWCKTLFSALFGCVFGVVGGAIEKMILSEGVARSGSAIAAWLIRKLKKFGYTQLSGKLALTIAKLGCNEQGVAQADATPTDSTGAIATDSISGGGETAIT